MSDLISRRAAIEKINERARDIFSLAPGYEYYLGALHDVANDLEQMPTIDVVRCKDCKYSRTEELTVKSKVGFLETRTIRFCNKNEMPIAVRADMHYCAWGERKDDE